jgi:hypothetical protein
MPLVINRFCLRFATQHTEGIGWAEYSGADWVMPKDNWGTMLLIDSNFVPRFVVFDRDNNVYECATFDRINEIRPAPTDKEVNGADGSEISWEKWGIEETASVDNEHKKIEHSESHVYVRPKYTEKRGQVGYTDSGLRDNLEIDLDCYVDGEKLSSEATTENIPENGDVVFSGHKVEARRIQFVWRGTASEVILTGIRHDLIAKMKCGSISERTMTEHSYELELASDKVVHLSRGLNLLKDRVSRNVLSGSVTSISGADGLQDSAFSTDTVIDLENPVVPNNYTIVMWADTQAPINGITFNQLSNEINGFKFVYAKDVTGLPANLELIDFAEYFDVRIYSKQISDGALNSMYNDVLKNQGRQYIPEF